MQLEVLGDSQFPGTWRPRLLFPVALASLESSSIFSVCSAFRWPSNTEQNVRNYVALCKTQPGMIYIMSATSFGPEQLACLSTVQESWNLLFRHVARGGNGQLDTYTVSVSKA